MTDTFIGLKTRKLFNRRIKHLLSIISNFDRFFWNTSKIYYFEVLKREISFVFGYNNDLISKFFDIIPLEEIEEFLFSNEIARPLTIRINSLKDNKAVFWDNLEKKGIKKIFTEKAMNFAAVIEKKNMKIGSNPEYLAGFFTLQGLSSFFSVIALSPQKGERILELAAAPGGKATYISQMMENTGICVANDKNKKRLRSLVSSVHRLGVENSIITNYDGSFLKFKIKGFDRVLIDAPCTGTGIISHDARIKLQKINSALLLNTTLQKRLLISAIDCSKKKKNSFIVYSTCSVLVEENESIIQYAFEKRKINIVATGLDFGLPGFCFYKNKKFNHCMKLCKRFYPHIHNIDGFFLCKIELR